MNNRQSGITARELRNVLISVVIFTVLFVYGLQFVAAITGVILVFALTLLIAIVLNPIVSWAERYKIPRGVSAAVLAVAVLGGIGLGIWLIMPLVIDQFRMLADQLPGYLARIRDWISSRAPSVAEQLPTSPGQIINRFSGIVGGVVGYAWNVLDVIASALVVLLGTIYLLASPRPLAQGLLSIFPPDKQDRVVTVMRRIGEQMRSWALATVGGMLVIFLLTWIALTIIDVQPAFLFAVIAGLLELVPIVGPILSAFPPALAALVTEPVRVLYVIVAFIIIQQIESNIIVPLLQGKSLQLHPLSIIFVVLVMAGLFGIVGVFLAVPTAATIKILYEEFYLKPAQKDHEEIRKRAEEIVSENNEQ